MEQVEAALTCLKNLQLSGRVLSSQPAEPAWVRIPVTAEYELPTSKPSKQK